jgi:hypothetical protein
LSGKRGLSWLRWLLDSSPDIFGYLDYWNGEVGKRLELDTKRTRYSIWVAGPNFAVPTGIEPALNLIIAQFSSSSKNRCTWGIFPIHLLRKGGNIYTLQALLGHTILDVVKRYLAIAQTDIDSGHEEASPLKCGNY